MHVIWTGERTRLRPFASADEALDTAQQAHGVTCPFWGPHWHTQLAIKRRFETNGLLSIDQSCVFAIERLDAGELIGYEMAALWLPQQLIAMVATNIFKAHQRRGFGVEAKHLILCFLFENFPIETAYAVTTAEHARARRGLDLSGMLFSGASRGEHYKQGRYWSTVRYAISREQWEKLPIRDVVKRG